MLKTAAYVTTTQLILARHTDETGNDEAFPVYQELQETEYTEDCFLIINP